MWVWRYACHINIIVYLRVYKCVCVCKSVLLYLYPHLKFGRTYISNCVALRYLTIGSFWLGPIIIGTCGVLCCKTFVQSIRLCSFNWPNLFVGFVEGCFCDSSILLKKTKHFTYTFNSYIQHLVVYTSFL